jgi:hypothetical protein
MGSVMYQTRQSKMFVAPLSNEGELLSTYTHGLLTAWAGNRFLSMRFPLARTVRLLPSVGWRGLRSIYRIMHLVILCSLKRQVFLPPLLPLLTR